VCMLGLAAFSWVPEYGPFLAIRLCTPVP
jgi:hypothetical protein